MQFSQPFPTTGFPNYGQIGQPCALNPPISYQINGYPDIIGEGNVVSVRSPDGSTQLLFFPSIPWPQCRSFPQNPYVGNLNNPYLTQPINTLGAWFVRNIFNPIQPALSQPDCCNLQYQRACSSDCCFNLSPPVLPIKFHNDNCTSTTDLHYFIPKQLNWFASPTGCAAVQASCPVATTATLCDYEVNCSKPCNCTPAQPCSCDVTHKREKQHTKCMCTKKSSSQMSIDSTRSNRSRRKGKHRTKSRNKPKKPSHRCECPPSSSDKGVTTYADQRIGCEPDRGQTTQTSSCSLPIIKGEGPGRGACNSMCYRAEKWSPKRCPSKNAMSQSTVSFGQCSVNTDSHTSCSTSGTDQE